MQVHQEASMEENVDGDHPWHVKSNDDDDACDSISNNEDSVTSSSSSELGEDVDVASSPTPSSSPSFGPLYELSELMAQLPIKRGLSKHYHGKSQSFTSLASVGSLEDLGKKESSYNQRMKSWRSYGWGLNAQRYGPKATITKRSSRKPFASSLGSRGTSAASCRPSISIEKSF